LLPVELLSSGDNDKVNVGQRLKKRNAIMAETLRYRHVTGVTARRSNWAAKGCGTKTEPR